MKRTTISNLIKKYLAGQATPDEQQQLEDWWKTSFTSTDKLDSIDEEEWSVLNREMAANIKSSIRKKSVPLVSWNKGWKVAASFLLLATAGALFYYYTTDKVIRTAYGEHQTIVLPDQSTVILNGNSKIRYARSWSEDADRAVWLEGEAFFSVKHTKNDNRFTVHSSDHLTIEVLGTQFNVVNRRGETNVVLQEGSVRLEDDNTSYLMKPNEMVSYSAANPTFVSHTVKAVQKVSWKDEMLVYENETVESIISRLTESHGLKVTYMSEDVKNEIFNGSIPTDSVTVFFEKIEKLYGVNVTVQPDGTYVIE